MTVKPIPDTSNETQRAIVDWGAIRRRVDEAQEALAQTAEPSPDEKRAVLKARAQALAKEPVTGDNEQKFIKIIQFRLASETYGIESEFVSEVYPLKDFTPLPGAPSFVLGIVNVRGQIVSVVDLKKFFNLPEKGLDELSKVIIIRNDRMEFGILADTILGIHLIALDAIQTPPATVTGIGAEYLKGVTGERVILLDAQKILDDGKMIVNELSSNDEKG